MVFKKLMGACYQAKGVGADVGCRVQGLGFVV